MHVRHWSVLVLHKYFRHPSHATCLEKRDYGSAVGLYLCEVCLGKHPALSLRVLLYLRHGEGCLGEHPALSLRVLLYLWHGEGCLGEHPPLSLRVLLLEVLQLLAGRRHPLELREIAEASVMKMQFM